MPAVRRCRPAPPIRPAALPLRGPEDALGVLLAGGEPPEPAIRCLLLDDEHRGLACLDVDGAAHAGAVLDLCDLLLSVAADQPALSAVVLASCRPGASHQPDPGDEACFHALCDQFSDAGLHLIDWFVVAGGLATSLAEHTGAAPTWSTDDGT